MYGSESGDRKCVFIGLFDFSYVFTQRFRGVGRGDRFGSSSVQKIVGESSVETFFELGCKFYRRVSGRGCTVFGTAFENLVEFLPVIGRTVFYVGHVFESSLYLERRYTRIEKLLQSVALIEVPKREQMLVFGDDIAFPVYEGIGKPAVLGAFAPVGTASAHRFAKIALSAVTDAQGSMHENFERDLYRSGYLVDLPQ